MALIAYRVTVGPICAGIIVDTWTDVIIETAPILRPFTGKQLWRLRKWVVSKKGKCERVNPQT